MIRMDISESTAHFTFAAACGLATFAAAGSIVLGTRHLQMPAALFLAFAIIGCYITIASYNRYTRLRNERWRRELKTTEDKLNQVFNHARMHLIVDHITGPLDEQMPAVSVDAEVVREHTVANT
jgi:hypothetical protein